MADLMTMLALPDMHRQLCWYLEIRNEEGLLTPYRFYNGMLEEYNALKARTQKGMEDAIRLYGILPGVIHMPLVPTRYWWPPSPLTVTYPGAES